MQGSHYYPVPAGVTAPNLSCLEELPSVMCRDGDEYKNGSVFFLMNIADSSYICWSVFVIFLIRMSIAWRIFPWFPLSIRSHSSILVTPFGGLSELAGDNSELWPIRTEILDWHVRQPIVLLKGVQTLHISFPHPAIPHFCSCSPEWEQLLLTGLLVLLRFRFCGSKAKIYIFLFHQHSSIIINFTENLGRDFR